eukprot:GHVL01030764.1.p1 GENE.GHVL01030764.1~~GHVL01030764.1.p1  ORF type:complete len:199 (+),score=49.93 GHVL01030764.1:17-613(+)
MKSLIPGKCFVFRQLAPRAAVSTKLAKKCHLCSNVVKKCYSFFRHLDIQIITSMFFTIFLLKLLKYKNNNIYPGISHGIYNGIFFIYTSDNILSIIPQYYIDIYKYKVYFIVYTISAYIIIYSTFDLSYIFKQILSLSINNIEYTKLNTKQIIIEKLIKKYIPNKKISDLILSISGNIWVCGTSFCGLILKSYKSYFI